MNVSPADDSSTPDADLIAMLRQRLFEVEEAATNYLLVVAQTGALREEAHRKLVTALTTDFKTAILSSHDMTPEQRDFWLEEIEREG